MATLGAILMILIEGLGLNIDKEVIIAAAGVLISFILGESYIDSKK